MANLLYLLFTCFAISTQICGLSSKRNSGLDNLAHGHKHQFQASTLSSKENNLLTSYLKKYCNFPQSDDIQNQLQNRLLLDNSQKRRFSSKEIDNDVIKKYKSELSTALQLKSNILRILKHLLAYSNFTEDGTDDLKAIEMLLNALTNREVFIGKLLPLVGILDESYKNKNLKILFNFLGDVLPLVYKSSANIMVSYVEKEKDNTHLEEVAPFLLHKIDPNFNIQSKYVDMDTYFVPYFNILTKHVHKPHYLDSDLVVKLFNVYPYSTNSMQFQEHLNQIMNHLRRNPVLRIVIKKHDLNIKNLLNKISDMIIPKNNKRRSLDAEETPIWIYESEQKQHNNIIAKIMQNMAKYDFPQDVSNGLDFLFVKKRQLLNLLPDMNVHKNALETVTELLSKITQISQEKSQVPNILPLTKSLYQNIKFHQLYNENNFKDLEKLTIPEIFDFYGHLTDAEFQSKLNNLKEEIIKKKNYNPTTIKFGANPRKILAQYLLDSIDKNRQDSDYIQKVVSFLKTIDNDGNYIDKKNINIDSNKFKLTEKSIPLRKPETITSSSDDIVDVSYAYDDYSERDVKPNSRIQTYDDNEEINKKTPQTELKQLDIDSNSMSGENTNPTKSFSVSNHHSSKETTLKPDHSNDNVLKKKFEEHSKYDKILPDKNEKDTLKNDFPTHSKILNSYVDKTHKISKPYLKNPEDILKYIQSATGVSENDIFNMYADTQKYAQITGDFLPFNKFINSLYDKISKNNDNSNPRTSLLVNHKNDEIANNISPKNTFSDLTDLLEEFTNLPKGKSHDTFLDLYKTLNVPEYSNPKSFSQIINPKRRKDIYVPKLSNLNGKLSQPTATEDKIKSLLKSKVLTEDQILELLTKYNKVSKEKGEIPNYDKFVHSLYNTVQEKKFNPDRPKSVLDILSTKRRFEDPSNDRLNIHDDIKKNPSKKGFFNYDKLMDSLYNILSKNEDKPEDILSPKGKSGEISNIEQPVVTKNTEDKLKQILSNSFLTDEQIIDLYKDFKNLPIKNRRNLNFDNYINWIHSTLNDKFELPKTQKNTIRESNQNDFGIPINNNQKLTPENEYIHPPRTYDPIPNIWNKLWDCNHDPNGIPTSIWPLSPLSNPTNLDQTLRKLDYQDKEDLQLRVQNIYNKLLNQEINSELFNDVIPQINKKIGLSKDLFLKLKGTLREFNADNLLKDTDTIITTSLDKTAAEKNYHKSNTERTEQSEISLRSGSQEEQINNVKPNDKIELTTDYHITPQEDNAPFTEKISKGTLKFLYSHEENANSKAMHDNANNSPEKVADDHNQSKMMN